MIGKDSIVIIYLQNPKEQIWGKIISLKEYGINIKGIEIKSFDDWLCSLNTKDESIGLGLYEVFFPMWRLEKIYLDENIEGLASLQERLENRTDIKIEEIFSK